MNSIKNDIDTLVLSYVKEYNEIYDTKIACELSYYLNTLFKKLKKTYMTNLDTIALFEFYINYAILKSEKIVKEGKIH